MINELKWNELVESEFQDNIKRKQIKSENIKWSKETQNFKN